MKQPPTSAEIISNLFDGIDEEWELNFTQKELVKNAMVEFAQRKCAEQRSNCARAYEKSDWVETNECIENILNAEEPTYE